MGPCLRLTRRVCDGRQAWQFSPCANTGAHAGARRIRNVQFARCLDADNRGGRLTGVIHVYQCNTSPHQAWEFKGGLRTSGTGCVWVAYLFIVQNQRVRNPFVTQWTTETGRPGAASMEVVFEKATHNPVTIRRQSPQ